MAIDEMRDFVGSAADALAYYNAAQAAYAAALRGPYVIKGIDYKPPSPDIIRKEIAYWSSQVFRLTKQVPPAPDLSLIQTEFDGPGSQSGSLPSRTFGQ